MNKPIGALVRFEWLDESAIQDKAYFSFGDYDDVSETDSFGIPDERIFYYVDGGEAGLIEMMNNPNLPEYKIIGYELTYPNDVVVQLESDENAILTLAEKLYEAMLMHFGLYSEYVKTNPDGTTENTAKGEELYFLIEDTLRGE